MSKQEDQGQRVPWMAIIAGLAGIGLLLSAHYFKGWFVDTDFRQLLFSNLFGVLIGAMIAVETERWFGERRERRRRADEEKQRQEDAQRALEALRKAINQNDKRVQEAIDQLESNPHAVVFLSTDPKTIESILPDVLETTGEVGLVRLVNEYRYKLEELGRKLDAQLDLGLHPQFIAGAGSFAPTIRQRREEIVEEILDDAKRLVSPSAIYERIEATRRCELAE